jgi:hypothetical protein
MATVIVPKRKEDTDTTACKICWQYQAGANGMCNTCGPRVAAKAAAKAAKVTPQVEAFKYDTSKLTWK